MGELPKITLGYITYSSNQTKNIKQNKKNLGLTPRAFTWGDFGPILLKLSETHFLSFFFLKILFIYFLERGKEGERKGEKQ